MKICIGARQSDLARLQAQLVAETLISQNPALQIEFSFRKAQGDIDLTSPLWKMADKGVFTADLSASLMSGQVDLVVHSWKDLPVEESADTEIVATLLRSDARDLLLFKKAHWSWLEDGRTLRIMTSSPRRQYNLAEFLPWALPFQKSAVRFDPVRGNIQTRIQKFMDDPECSAFVLAKAAMDRLLASHSPEYEKTREFLRQTLDKCLFMVLPLRENPTAAAQGALAIEVRKQDTDIRSLVQSINHKEDFENVMEERNLLSSYGGGCHQKIGAAVFAKPFGKVISVRGKTDAAEELRRWQLQEANPVIFPPATSSECVFPLDMADAALYERHPLPVKAGDLMGYDLFLAKANALPDSIELPFGGVVWVSGSHSWRKLAQRGVWVSGSCEALGEDENSDLATLLGRPARWLKLTHDKADTAGEKKKLVTYSVRSKKALPDLSHKTHFFWASYVSFEEARRAFPKAIEEGYHAAGPGHTYAKIQKALADKGRLKIYLSYQDWKSEILRRD